MPTAIVLQLEARPNSQGSGHISVLWAQDTPYLFPPFNMVGGALMKIQQEKVYYACLIVPAWSGLVWYPQLMKILMKSPIYSQCRKTWSWVQFRHHIAGLTTLSSLAYLRQRYTMQGFSQRVTNMLLQSWRSHTHTLSLQLNPRDPELVNIGELIWGLPACLHRLWLFSCPFLHIRTQTPFMSLTKDWSPKKAAFSSR